MMNQDASPKKPAAPSQSPAIKPQIKPQKTPYPTASVIITYTFLPLIGIFLSLPMADVGERIAFLISGSILAMLLYGIPFFIVGTIIAISRLRKNLVGGCLVTVLGGFFASLPTILIYLYSGDLFELLNSDGMSFTLVAVVGFTFLSLLAGMVVLPSDKIQKQALTASAPNHKSDSKDIFTQPQPATETPTNDTESDAHTVSHHVNEADFSYLDDIDLNKPR